MEKIFFYLITEIATWNNFYLNKDNKQINILLEWLYIIGDKLLCSRIFMITNDKAKDILTNFEFIPYF
jgi:hypothetical protein